MALLNEQERHANACLQALNRPAQLANHLNAFCRLVIALDQALPQQLGQLFGARLSLPRHLPEGTLHATLCLWYLSACPAL